MVKRASILLRYSVDVFLIQLSYYLALMLRFEGQIDPKFWSVYTDKFLEITLIKLVIFTYFKLYKQMYRYAGVNELINIGAACVMANTVAVSYLSLMELSLPRSVYIIVGMLDVFLIGGVRLSVRILSKTGSHTWALKKVNKRLMVVGGGDAGAMIIKELLNHRELKSRPVAIIDDDVKKEGKRIYGVPVVGQREDIIGIVRKMKVDEIVIAIPSANKKQIKAVVEECKQTKAKIKILPGMYELIDGSVTMKSVRDVEIKDILGRDEVSLDASAISSYLEDKVVMVTGGGGSIGSELCRQIIGFKPKTLVVLDIYENNAFELQNELLKHNPQLNLIVKIASVRDRKMIREIVSEMEPDVIFHAAAHKHVPLMEANPKAAIKNNVFGTLNLAQAAHEFGVNRFVLISTDKAVNPTNIMGASKRLCEMIVQSLNPDSKTEFVAVRFGNVLGSNGSVIPTFKRQISEGGPVTVTHNEITRYFMTIPEASQLVLQAGAMAKGGEIFILDMGEPVKILNLAEDLIRLSGYEPYDDIPIVFSGLRPGEKLYEELLLSEEGMSTTPHEKIFVGKPSDLSYEELLIQLETLRATLPNMSLEQVKGTVSELVPTYTLQK